MPKHLTPLLIVCLMAASGAYAQSGGGHGGGGHGGGGHGGGGHGGGGKAPGGARSARSAAPPAKAFVEPEIIGVVKLIDPGAGRVTIAYEPVEALNWAAGTQPFVVSKSALLKDLAVGEKVRFSLESQQIAAIRPF